MGSLRAAWIGAGATLLTGLAAVVGAVLVGLRQVKISERQTALLDRQIAVQDLAVRETLFERRFEFHEQLAQFTAKAMRKDAVEEREKDIADFIQVLRRAKFFFPAAAHDELRKLLYIAINRTDALEDFKEAETDVEREQIIQSRVDLRYDLVKQLDKVTELIEPHIRLA